MTIKNIEPFVRYARKLNHFIPATVIAPDHRLFYCTAAWADLEVSAAQIRLAHGDLLFVPAGTPYRAVAIGEGFGSITLNFDFSWERSSISAAVLDKTPWSSSTSPTCIGSTTHSAPPRLSTVLPSVRVLCTPCAEAT